MDFVPILVGAGPLLTMAQHARVFDFTPSISAASSLFKQFVCVLL